MQESMEITRQTAKKTAERTIGTMMEKCSVVLCYVLCPGDRVLVKNLTPRGGTGKLRNHWEDVVHTVVRQVGGEGLIYEVRPEQGKARSCVLPRNILMLCEYFPLEIYLGKEGRTKGQVKRSKPVKKCEPGPEEEEEENEGYPYNGYPPAIQPQNPGQGSVEFRDENVPEVQFQQPVEGNRGLINEDLQFIRSGESEKKEKNLAKRQKRIMEKKLKWKRRRYLNRKLR